MELSNLTVDEALTLAKARLARIIENYFRPADNAKGCQELVTIFKALAVEFSKEADEREAQFAKDEQKREAAASVPAPPCPPGFHPIR